MTTTVVHVKDPGGYDVYGGRRMPGICNESSPLANPWRMNRESDREKVIELYADYFFKRLEADWEFKQFVLSCKDKRLACWCKSYERRKKDKHCHLDVVADYLDGMASYKEVDI